MIALLPSGNKMVVGEQTKVEFQTTEGKPINELIASYGTKIKPTWQVTKGEERLKVNEDGTLVALQPGEVTLQGTVPGLAADTGFLFIEALGRVGAIDSDGTIHWDILVMVLGFGVSLYVNQLLSGQAQGAGANPQQETINKMTPIIFSGMFLFFPLPAGVLLYMLIANIFQTVQAFILSREPLPENIQKIVDEAEAKAKREAGREALPFEPGRSSKKKA